MNKLRIIFFVFIVSILLNAFLVSADEYNMLLGDADNNNVIDASDALRILKIVADLEDMGSDFSIRKSDCDYNYRIDANDALEILKTSAGLTNKIELSNPQNFYNTINYNNGYPENDFISCNLDRNVQYSIEEGITVKNSESLTGAYIEKYIEGVKQEDAVRIGSDHADFDKLYWELRWLIEDAKKNNQIEAQEKSEEFYNEIVKEQLFSGYHYEVYTITEALKNVHSSVFVYISETNEMYFYVVRRSDLYTSDEYGTVYKYTGEIPENLKYESIEKIYN